MTITLPQQVEQRLRPESGADWTRSGHAGWGASLGRSSR